MTTRYDDLLNLAAACDAAGQQLRERARLGTAILTDPAVTETAELSPAAMPWPRRRSGRPPPASGGC